jgi:hypothetical protein
MNIFELGNGGKILYFLKNIGDIYMYMYISRPKGRKYGILSEPDI